LRRGNFTAASSGVHRGEREKRRHQPTGAIKKKRTRSSGLGITAGNVKRRRRCSGKEEKPAGGHLDGTESVWKKRGATENWMKNAMLQLRAVRKARPRKEGVRETGMQAPSRGTRKKWNYPSVIKETLGDG